MLKKGRKYAFKRRPRTATNCAFPPLELEKKKKWRKKRKKKNLSPPFIYFFSCPLSLFLPFLYCCPFVDHLHWKRGKKKKGANPRKRWKIKYRRLTMYTPSHTVLHPTRKQCLFGMCSTVSYSSTYLYIYISIDRCVYTRISLCNYLSTCTSHISPNRETPALRGRS